MGPGTASGTLIHDHDCRRIGVVIQYRTGPAARSRLPIAWFNRGVMGLIEHIHVHAAIAQCDGRRGQLVVSGGLFGNGKDSWWVTGTIFGGGIVDLGERSRKRRQKEK